MLNDHLTHAARTLLGLTQVLNANVNAATELGTTVCAQKAEIERFKREARVRDAQAMADTLWQHTPTLRQGQITDTHSDDSGRLVCHFTHGAPVPVCLGVPGSEADRAKLSRFGAIRRRPLACAKLLCVRQVKQQQRTPVTRARAVVFLRACCNG
jgi:hypothetical protein